MRYISISPEQKEQMLKELGLKHIEDLFSSVPAKLRLKEPLDLPAAADDITLQSELKGLAEKNKTTSDYISFLGGGSYDHYIPAVVDALSDNPAFVTAYTPYQAEASQGILQLFYEYQTLICELTGMEVSNASMYEGATALAEAALMARDITARDELIVARSVHPEYTETLRTYISALPMKIIELSCDKGIVDPEELAEKLSEKTAAVIVQQPNFFGLIERLDKISELLSGTSSLFIVVFDPISSGLIKPPGRFGADIVVGEGQSLGIPQGFGGPYLGFLATREKYMRRIPGRLVGATVDREGRRSFCLTLQTREQHIRRERATSNICSNEGLLAIRAAIYLSAIGKKGLKEVANLCFQKANYLYRRLIEVDEIQPLFAGRPFFKEFAIRLEGVSLDEFLRYAKGLGVLAGLKLACWFDEYKDGLLIAVTEKRTKEELDYLVDIFKDFIGKRK